MPNYTYEGNRDPQNSASAIVYEDQNVAIGEDIKLSASERDRLLPYFILSSDKSEDLGEGQVAPTTVSAADAAVATAPEPDSTSDDRSTIKKKNQTSSSPSSS